MNSQVNRDRAVRRIYRQNARVKEKIFGQSKAISSIELAQKVRPNIITLIEPSSKMIAKAPPDRVLTSNRFDLIAKYIYAKHHELKIDSQWALRLYVEHLRVLNGWVEPDGTGKKGIEAFLEAFHSILKSIRTFGFDEGLSLIPIGRDNIILDGSHRVAACLLYRKEFTGLFCDIPAYVYNHQFFRSYTKHVKTGLGAPWTDAMALEYCRLKQNIYIVTVFPAAQGQEEQIQRILRENGEIVYSKAVKLTGQGPVLLMRQMYSAEKWLGSWSNNFQGARQKAALCFTSSGPVRIYVLETDQFNRVNTAKNKIRDLFKIGNHSVHINDTREETLRLAQIFFNANSIQFLNNAEPKPYAGFHKLLDFYSNWLCNQAADKEYFCIDGSAVMAAYGIREARDIDFLFFGNDNLVTGHKLVSCHNHEVHHYPTSRDDILFNPENHFYFNGLKFATLNMVLSMKAKRAEAKDGRDLAKIDKFFHTKDIRHDQSGKPVTFQSNQYKIRPGIDPPRLINYVYGHTQFSGYAVHKGNTSIIWSRDPVDNCDVYYYQDAFSYRKNPDGLKVLGMHEPTVVLPGQYSHEVWQNFNYIFTSLDSLAMRSEKFVKIDHPAFDGPHRGQYPHSISLGYHRPLEIKKIAICMISGNKTSKISGELYSKRVEAAHWFHNHSKIPFDVYGRPPFSQLQNYRGELATSEQKYSTLSRYRYSLCFENIYHLVWSQGYVSEKILHCLMCGTVPIYLGCSNIENYVPLDCFIDFRRFAGLSDLNHFLTRISDSDYRAYLDRIGAWVRAGHLNRYSIHHLYDKLAGLANPAASLEKLSKSPWLAGLAPVHRNNFNFNATQLDIVWTWKDLANPASLPDALQSKSKVRNRDAIRWDKLPSSPAQIKTKESVKNDLKHSVNLNSNLTELTSIIILNFNGGSQIKNCLSSIQENTPEPHEIIVVDNASMDGSQEFLREFSGIVLIENKKNLGCPPARAQAMAVARGEYMVLLDNDTIVTAGWLANFLSHFRDNPRIGLLGPRSNFASGPQMVGNPKYSSLQELQEFAQSFVAKHSGRLSFCFRLVGFCMAIRRSVIDKIGSLDPQFGKFGFEDEDYTLRAIIAGFHAAIAHDVFIHHQGGPQVSGDTRYNADMQKAWYVFKRKWGLPLELVYGARYDKASILSNSFSPLLHFIPVMEKSQVDHLIYNSDNV
jgi:GT2 family glycosyltransferase